jgi:hypothetical protein
MRIIILSAKQTPRSAILARHQSRIDFRPQGAKIRDLFASANNAPNTCICLQRKAPAVTGVTHSR